MVDFWESIKNTGESFAGALEAAPGAMIDLASMPFDSEDDDLGSVLSTLAKRGGDLLDPVLNPETVTGAAFSKAMEGLYWASINGVSEPVSTFAMATAHSAQQGSASENLSALFSGQTWSEAYDRAQNVSAGQALTSGLLDPNSDPLAYEDVYEEVTAKEHTRLGPGLSFGMNAVGAWFLDPAIVAGKGVSLARRYFQHHKLTAADKARLYTDVTQSSRTGMLKRDPKSRTDRYLDWIGGTNSQARPLTAPEILHGTPELKKYAAEPHVIAGLLADANKIEQPNLRRNAQRRILAVAGGDTSQIARLQQEIAEAPHLADALSNMVRGGAIDLKRLGAEPGLRVEPEFVYNLERQLANLNSRGDIDKFMDGWTSRLDQLLKTHDTMPNLPGVHMAGERAIKRQNDTGLLRSGKNAHEKVDEWAAKQWATAQSASTLYQKGRYTVPIVAVKTFGLAASPYTKAPVKFADAMRQAHFTGIANLHDWGGATTQLDSMMRLSGVQPGARMKALSEAYLAKSEPEKMRAIEKIEKLSMGTLSEQFSAKFGKHIDRDYIETLMTKHAEKRGNSLAQLRGRSYSATNMTDQMLATRGGSMAAADDTARWTQSEGFSSQPQGKWRVDQIDDNGTPLSLPLLDTQLGNSVPLLDMGIAKKLLERDTSYLSRLSRSWREDAMELKRLTELKRRGAQGLDKAIAAKTATIDWLVQAGQVAMRGWKFSVLFRLGYPIRVVSDDHWRIWTQMNAGTFYFQNGNEFRANLWHNAAPAMLAAPVAKGRGLAAAAVESRLPRVAKRLAPGDDTRRLAARKALHDAKVRRDEIKGLLDGDLMTAHDARRAALRTAERSLAGHKRQVAKLRQQIEEAETKRSLGIQVDIKALRTKLGESEAKVADKQGAVDYYFEQLGDFGPDALKKELAQLDEAIAKGPAAFREEKRRIGSTNVKLDDGVEVEGSMAGLHGAPYRSLTSSQGTFDIQLRGVEDRMFEVGMGGSHRVIQADEPGHLDAWSDVLNHQFRQSPVAMHFIKGGDLDGFVKWVKAPEQAQLRQRLAHFAHDPEDWGGRVQAMVHDYIPTEALREAVEKGRVSPATLRKMFRDQQPVIPAVHGRAVADNIGTSERALGVSRTMNRIYKFLGEMPTDRLSRHPYFNSLYKQHAKSVYETRKVAYADMGRKFTQDDLDNITQTARKLALNDLKRTLFDISAHSHAAHVMRFVSPFFAAHQESIARWWRIVGDDPSIVRRFTQAFDVPRHLGLVVNEDGELVKPGEPISREHRILLQLPKAWGGPDTDPNNPNSQWSKWSLSENSFNLVLQGGLTNPGAGPLVTVPVEYFAKKYADETEIARVARVFNPFPPQHPIESAMPATFKRLSAAVYGKTKVDISFGMGIGQREYNDAYSQNMQDLMVQFNLEHGREPNKAETDELMLQAGRESTVQMFHRFLWNATSPAPATPRSKYNVIQQGWYRIAEQARTEGKDFDWAYAQFKAKWGAAYMPLVYSEANNPAHLDATPGTIAAIKRYKGVLNRVDPALHRAVIGAYADDLAEENVVMGEYSPEARSFLRTDQMQPGSPGTYYSYDDPRTAMQEQMARRGWQKYGELTGALTAQAEKMGLSSYLESDQLLALKRAGVERIRQENFAFDREYGEYDSTQYDRYLGDMRTLVSAKALAGDTERTDIQVLASYLKLRDFITAVLAKREEAGLGGPDAQANEPVREVFTQLVGRLVESNTYFENHIFNGLVERDPLLVGG